MCRDKFVIKFPREHPSRLEARVETDRGQNVAGQLKRFGFKTALAAIAEPQSKRATTASRLMS
jgi:hypothetical protein